jgi:hypothetical protein
VGQVRLSHSPRSASLLGPITLTVYSYTSRETDTFGFYRVRFFANQDERTYLIRVHAPPNFTFDETNTNAPAIFVGTEIKDPVFPVTWGGVSVVNAEKRLLKSALASTAPIARRFVLLSESCVPIRTFPFTRDYLFDGDVFRRDVRGTDKSFLELGFDRHNRWPGRGREEIAKALPAKVRAWAFPKSQQDCFPIQD